MEGGDIGEKKNSVYDAEVEVEVISIKNKKLRELK